MDVTRAPLLQPVGLMSTRTVDAVLCDSRSIEFTNAKTRCEMAMEYITWVLIED